MNANSSFDVKTQSGLRFAVHDGEELLADFHAPVTAAAVPVVIAAHGGAWKLGGRDYYQEASPYSYATAHANETAFLLIWGQEDDMIDWRSQSQRFLVALRQAGYTVRAAVVPGAGHFFMKEPIDEPHSFAAFVAPRLLRFLNDCL